MSAKALTGIGFVEWAFRVSVICHSKTPTTTIVRMQMHKTIIRLFAEPVPHPPKGHQEAPYHALHRRQNSLHLGPRLR